MESKQPKKKIRVGVVGTGYLGKYHADKYARMENVELVGVADIDRPAAEEVANRHRTRAFADHRALLQTVDAVSIVVPTSLHFDISRDFLDHNVDVLIEKPMTTTLEQADELVAFAESKGLIIQVGHLERFNPAVVALRGIVNRPMFIESHRLSVYKDRALDVSVVLDLMIHDIDLISNFVGAGISDIRAAGIPVITEQVDIANARLEFDSGCVANVTASRVSMKNERKIRLFQRDAYISVDFANHSITLVRRNEEVRDSLIPGMEIRQLQFDKGDALEDELKAFIQAVGERKTPEVDGRVGRNALQIALHVMDQINTTNKRFLTPGSDDDIS
ncbi:MAG: UDP-N-acetyl-D-glucosamine dehydrogenase [Deltaproteobacteria bacterium SG8_13]|nr:MAG: UDP-N-acetyl-D-glucosamine dehydrogenase [Deltaproteobacteria bacterium SG8_13]